jgi:hypothetical protein
MVVWSYNQGIEKEKPMIRKNLNTWEPTAEFGIFGKSAWYATIEKINDRYFISFYDKAHQSLGSIEAPTAAHAASSLDRMHLSAYDETGEGLHEKFPLVFAPTSTLFTPDVPDHPWIFNRRRADGTYPDIKDFFNRPIGGDNE